jgi:hypothetical protein
MSAPSLRERVESIPWFTTPGYPDDTAICRDDAIKIAVDGDATIAALRKEVDESGDVLAAGLAIKDAHIQSIQHDHRREIEQRRLDWDRERTALVVKTREQAARIAELEAEVARLSAPAGVEPVAWLATYTHRSRGRLQYVSTSKELADENDDNGSAHALVYASALRTLQARLAAAEGALKQRLPADVRTFTMPGNIAVAAHELFVQFETALAARSAGTGEAGA